MPSWIAATVSPVSIREPTEIEQAIATFASSPNGGVVLTASALSSVHHNLIVSLVARYKLPAFSAGFVLGMLGMYIAAWLYGYRQLGIG